MTCIVLPASHSQIADTMQLGDGEDGNDGHKGFGFGLGIPGAQRGHSAKGAKVLADVHRRMLYRWNPGRPSNGVGNTTGGGDGGCPTVAKANWLVQACLASRTTHTRTLVHQELSLAQGVINGVMLCIVSVGCGAGGKNCSGDTADADREESKYKEAGHSG